MNTILQLIASLSLLVFIHELGHFFFARLFGARVEKFYLFFHPWFSIFKYQSKRSGTVYGLGWLPLGGYCKIAGMIDESLDEEGIKSEPKPDEFRSKKPWQRLLIMAGGIIFNLILAALIYIMIALVWGDKRLDSKDATYGYTFSSVGHEVGFIDGDVLLSIDGDSKLNTLDARLMNTLLHAHNVQVLRNGKDTISLTLPDDLLQRVLASEQSFASLSIPFVVDSVVNPQLQHHGLIQGDQVVGVAGEATPLLSNVLDALQKHKEQSVALSVRTTSGILCQIDSVAIDSEGHIGVQLKGITDIYPVQPVHYNFFTAIPAGVDKAMQTASSYVGGLKLMFTKEGAKQMGGLGTMGKLFPTQFDWQAFWAITAFLSIILAVMNLLPIPALDGGHILFIIVEMIRGKQLSDQTMMRIQTVGLILLALLMLYANGNDIYRYLIK